MPSDPLAPSPAIRLMAVGDILLTTPPDPARYRRDPALLADDLRALADGCDLVLANLECTLAGSGATVATEPRVVALPEMVRAVARTGVDVVTLANNHAFDCLDEGFGRLTGLLDELGLPWFGAGLDLARASQPVILERNGLRVAMLGAVDRATGPSRFAGPDGSGVLELDIDHIRDQIARLGSQADHVLVSLHWGEERLGIPAPRQVEQARALIDAGASMILGHHPHVVQGMEMHAGRPIIYSLGNFLADPVYFTNTDPLEWSHERTGCVLLADLDRHGVHNVRQVPTWDDGCRVRLGSRPGRRRIARVNRALARGVTLRRYRRAHLWVHSLKPILTHLHPRRLARLRPTNLARAWTRLRHSLRAGR